MKWPSWQAVDRVNAQRWRPVGSVGTQHSIWPPPGQCWFQQNDEILDQCFCQNNKDTLHPRGLPYQSIGSSYSWMLCVLWKNDTTAALHKDKDERTWIIIQYYSKTWIHASVLVYTNIQELKKPVVGLSVSRMSQRWFCFVQVHSNIRTNVFVFEFG